MPEDLCRIVTIFARVLLFLRNPFTSMDIVIVGSLVLVMLR